MRRAAALHADSLRSGGAACTYFSILCSTAGTTATGRPWVQAAAEAETERCSTGVPFREAGSQRVCADNPLLPTLPLATQRSRPLRAAATLAELWCGETVASPSFYCTDMCALHVTHGRERNGKTRGKAEMARQKKGQWRQQIRYLSEALKCTVAPP